MLDASSFESPTRISQQQISLAAGVSPSNDLKRPPFSDYYAVDNFNAYNYSLLDADLYPDTLPLDYSYSDTSMTNISLIESGLPYLDPSLSLYRAR